MLRPTDGGQFLEIRPIRGASGTAHAVARFPNLPDEEASAARPGRARGDVDALATAAIECEFEWQSGAELLELQTEGRDVLDVESLRAESGAATELLGALLPLWRSTPTEKAFLAEVGAGFHMDGREEPLWPVGRTTRGGLVLWDDGAFLVEVGGLAPGDSLELLPAGTPPRPLLSLPVRSLERVGGGGDRAETRAGPIKPRNHLGLVGGLLALLFALLAALAVMGRRRARLLGSRLVAVEAAATKLREDVVGLRWRLEALEARVDKLDPTAHTEDDPPPASSTRPPDRQPRPDPPPKPDPPPRPYREVPTPDPDEGLGGQGTVGPWGNLDDALRGWEQDGLLSSLELRSLYKALHGMGTVWRRVRKPTGSGGPPAGDLGAAVDAWTSAIGWLSKPASPAPGVGGRELLDDLGARLTTSTAGPRILLSRLYLQLLLPMVTFGHGTFDRADNQLGWRGAATARDFWQAVDTVTDALGLDRHPVVLFETTQQDLARLPVRPRCEEPGPGFETPAGLEGGRVVLVIQPTLLPRPDGIWARVGGGDTNGHYWISAAPPRR